ncbi:MAG: hypothetical protein AB1491_06170 [Thermodesulfobacteriota bacterium]
MNLPRIVCPPDPGLLQSFVDRTVLVRVPSLGEAAAAAARVGQSGNRLLCVIVESDSPLADLDFQEDQKAIPLAVMAPSTGQFRHLARQLDLLRSFNLRVYLPGHHAENLVGLRILSSVGIYTCAVLGNGSMDWEALADLMTYAVLERVPHAAIEPFNFIASRYDPAAYLEWGGIFFDDPKTYLHLDGKGRVALSPAELRKKQFIAQSIAEIPEPAEFPAIRERLQAWRQYFLDNHPCASCPGWKICLGRFAGDGLGNQGCAGFFLEMLEVARQFKNRQTQAEEFRIWQP